MTPLRGAVDVDRGDGHGRRRCWSWAGAPRAGGGAAPRCWPCRCACSARRWRSTSGSATSPPCRSAWSQLTSGPLPDQTDRPTVTAMPPTRPGHRTARVVPVTSPPTRSHFNHRGELVYLPPAWFASTPPPPLPAVMMIGGRVQHPGRLAARGQRGQDDRRLRGRARRQRAGAGVRRFRRRVQQRHRMRQRHPRQRRRPPDQRRRAVHDLELRRQPDRANWGVVGWSMGGTCAVDLAVMHPELFSAFVDIAGDLGPNAGNKAQTIARLFGGNADAWAAFDPTTVITRARALPRRRRLVRASRPTAAGPTSRPPADRQRRHPCRRTRRGRQPGRSDRRGLFAVCARPLQRDRLRCGAQPGKHDWPFADRAFAASLPWLAGVLGTPGIPRTPLPAASAPVAGTPVVVPAQRSNTASNSACVIRRARSAGGLRSALPSVERMDPMGEHAADPGADLDAAKAHAVWIALWLTVNPLVFGKPAHHRAWSTRAMLGEELWISRRPRDAAMVVSAAASDGRTGSDIRRAPASAAASADRPRAADGAYAGVLATDGALFRAPVALA